MEKKTSQEFKLKDKSIAQITSAAEIGSIRELLLFERSGSGAAKCVV
jgi:hypothetical protein